MFQQCYSSLIITLQHNGFVESMITISMIKAKEILNRFWGEAVSTAVHIINRCPTRKIIRTQGTLWSLNRFEAKCWSMLILEWYGQCIKYARSGVRTLATTKKKLFYWLVTTDEIRRSGDINWIGCSWTMLALPRIDRKLIVRNIYSACDWIEAINFYWFTFSNGNLDFSD
jgi:hypothetical protein